MGKNGRFQKSYGKVIGEGSHDNRPGWKGPGYQKPKEKAKPKVSTKSKDEEQSETASLVPLELQQVVLNIFRDVFSDVVTSNELKETLQEVKGALYERDFERAFGKKEYLEAYAVRWSPSRALCYQSILVDIYEHMIELLPSFEKESKSFPSPQGDRGFQIVCFGGGAAEAVAFGAFLRYFLDTNLDLSAQPINNIVESTVESEKGSLETLQPSVIIPPPLVSVQLFDIAQWGEVIEKLHQGLITPPILSKYASAAAKAANSSLLAPKSIATTFKALDVLELTREQIASRFGKKPMLLTLLFTLNELYTASLSKTTAFLLNLTLAVPKGTLLLVVDSPGSYSETKVGNAADAKKYPMKWLMDHALLESHKRHNTAASINDDGDNAERNKDEHAAWEKKVEDDSRWFRIPEGLKYAIPLENMRYQIHLYQRL